MPRSMSSWSSGVASTSPLIARSTPVASVRAPTPLCHGVVLDTPGLMKEGCDLVVGHGLDAIDTQQRRLAPDWARSPGGLPRLRGAHAGERRLRGADRRHAGRPPPPYEKPERRGHPRVAGGRARADPRPLRAPPHRPRSADPGDHREGQADRLLPRPGGRHHLRELHGKRSFEAEFIHQHLDAYLAELGLLGDEISARTFFF